MILVNQLLVLFLGIAVSVKEEAEYAWEWFGWHESGFGSCIILLLFHIRKENGHIFIFWRLIIMMKWVSEKGGRWFYQRCWILQRRKFLFGFCFGIKKTCWLKDMIVGAKGRFYKPQASLPLSLFAHESFVCFYQWGALSNSIKWPTSWKFCISTTNCHQSWGLLLWRYFSFHQVWIS